MIQVSPSILASDFCRLGEAVEMINESRATMIHVDVMDGVFVPNISIGFPVITSLAKVARKPLDVHLMIVDPIRYIGVVRDAGASLMNVHQEACTHLWRTIDRIKAAGMKAAVTLNPATPLIMLEEVLPELDMVLLMGVNPGFGGQKFIEATVDKVARLKEMIKACGSSTLIEVDGGVNPATGRRLVKAGADVLVAGSYVFNAPDPIESISVLADLDK